MSNNMTAEERERELKKAFYTIFPKGQTYSVERKTLNKREEQQLGAGYRAYTPPEGE